MRSESDRKATTSCELKRILNDSLRKSAVRDWVRDRVVGVLADNSAQNVEVKLRPGYVQISEDACRKNGGEAKARG